MLLIHAAVCYQDLLGDTRYEPLLRDQVESLVREIDASPHGLLDDYPGQCFPSDVIAALAAIRRADRLLGTDHGEFLTRSLRGFQGGLVDDRTGLPPYMADSKGGHATEARGSTSQWACAWAPLVWPDKASEWYRAFETHFWQTRWGAVGLREFTREQAESEWTFDVDAGPVLGGFAVATTAFGIGAARMNGRFDDAYPLSAETIALSWPLPDGTLLLPRILSRGLGSPYVGEAAILYNLTRQLAEGMPKVRGGTLPAVVFGVLGLLLVRVMMDVWSTWRQWHQIETWIGQRTFWWPRVQWGLWLLLTLSGLWIFFSGDLIVGLLVVCSSQLLPLGRRISGPGQPTPGRS